MPQKNIFIQVKSLSLIDECSELDNAYIFYCKDDENYEGGNHTPCVIIKETGEAVNIPTYITEYGYGKEIRNFNL